MSATIQLRTRVFIEECNRREWYTASSQARGLGIAPSSTWRILEGDSAPGPVFIAATLSTFDNLSFADLFEIVDAPADGHTEVVEVVEEMSA